MSDEPIDELAVRRAMKGSITRGEGGSIYFYSPENLAARPKAALDALQVLVTQRPAQGKALDMIASAHALKRRGLLERLPFIGDRRFHRRVQALASYRYSPVMDARVHPNCRCVATPLSRWERFKAWILGWRR